MKRLLAIVPAAAAVVALSLAPAMAKSKKHDRHGAYEQSYRHGAHHGSNSRYVAADPSFGNRAGIDSARRTGRCVADLGYGRYEYCGW
jgi:hypothetical protein